MIDPARTRSMNTSTLNQRTQAIRSQLNEPTPNWLEFAKYAYGATFGGLIVAFFMIGYEPAQTHSTEQAQETHYYFIDGSKFECRYLEPATNEQN